MSFVREFFKFILSFSVSVILIVIGAVLVGFGISSGCSTLIAIGALLICAGALWVVVFSSLIRKPKFLGC